ncbi:MAG: hypothetical protein WBB85_21075 [Albidovulum sp.]|uniref:hypothetical protein n=1 Tax=Albidovulum sp. TaxID=1872424 RepID=UPI003CB05D5D
MMADSQANSRLSAALAVDLSQFPKDALARWLPQIEDADLRTDLMNNPRLKNRIQIGLMAANGLAEDAEHEVGDEEPILLWLLDQDISKLCQSLGNAWLSNALAELMVSGGLAERYPDLQRGSLIKALKFRDAAPAANTVSQTAKPAEEGRSCLLAFLSRLPPATDKALRVRLQLPPTIVAEPQRAVFCRHLLSTLVEAPERK